MEASASAPGKILWIGGYSVLERPNISYVTAVKSYVTVNARPSGENSLELDAPQLGMRAKGSVDLSTGKVAADAPKELVLLKTSVEVALRYASATGAKVQGLSIRTNNDPQFSYSIAGGKVVKSGLGSSAALTVAAIASALKALEVKANRNQIHKLAQTAHSIATGKVGSGFDIAAASYGSIIYTRYSPEIVKNLPPDYSNKELLGLVKKRWDYTAEKFPLPKEFRLTFANFVGESMITTASVGSVSEFKKGSPEAYNEIVGRLNQANVEAVEALRRIGNGEQDAMEAFKGAFDRGRALSKELGSMSRVGIEPDDCTSLIEESKSNGAFVAKLPGAGGKDSIAALSASREEQTRLRRFWRKRKELGILKLKTSKKGFSS
ncbi:MAG TPA: hypothetical protein VL945_00585 [Candidatus Saccharimonadales bacterium]|nr:hypothetical protein [Candidatus Saccharimonadales bacterium]